MDPDDEDACEFCSYGGAPTELYEGHGMSADMRLCEVCATSFAGNIARYPKQYDHGIHALAQIISQQTNYLLEKLNKL